MSEMKIPNIFEYATSELSQDAFICWALEYAKDGFKNHEDEDVKKLHAFGKELLQVLINTYNDKQNVDGFNTYALDFDEKGKAKKEPKCQKHQKQEIPDGLKVLAIKRQDQKLDVAIHLSDDYVLMIEDKTNTSNHGNQLLRYKYDFTKNKTKYKEKPHSDGKTYPEEKQIRIYFKTGYQHSFDDVNQKGWAEFTLDDLITILKKHKEIENSIFRSFWEYQKSEYDKYNKWQDRKISNDNELNRHDIYGIYKKLKFDNSFPNSNSGYAANQSGGIQWYYIGGSDWEIHGKKCYLQLENDNKNGFRLIVKTYNPPESENWNIDDRRNLISNLKTISKKYEFSEDDIIKAVDRFKSGKYQSTVHIRLGEKTSMPLKSDGCLNYEKMADSIKKAMNLLHAVVRLEQIEQ